MKILLKVLGWGCFIVGVLLLLINMVGLFLTMRDPRIYEEQKEKIKLTESEFYVELNKIKDLSTKEYVYAVNKLVNQGMAHYWEDDAMKKYNLRIPIWENYILFFRSFLNPNYRKYEFCDSKKAVERGVGMCSQQSSVLIDVLKNHGLKANWIVLNGHIVVTSLVDKEKGEWWILDPDFGVVIEKDLYILEKNPIFVRSSYEKFFDLKNISEAERLESLVTLYTTSEDNIVVQSGVKGYLGKSYCIKEKVYYLLIWVIPILLLLPIIYQKLYLKSFLRVW